MVEDSNDLNKPRPAATNAPRVDEALQATSTRTSGSAGVAATDELRAMKAEVQRMKESIEDMAAASRRLALAGATSFRDELEANIRARPWAAIGLAALTGYLYGIRR